MGFGEAVSTCFSQYATFTGRAIRAEYWYWVLFCSLAGAILTLVEVVISDTAGSALGWLFDLATIVPTIAVAARRLHDIDRSGWWQLLGFIPIIGWVILLVWFSQDGTRAATGSADPNADNISDSTAGRPP
jgi:uncharacterized membrane protein YhaH (DUF805 family)